MTGPLKKLLSLIQQSIPDVTASLDESGLIHYLDLTRDTRRAIVQWHTALKKYGVSQPESAGYTHKPEVVYDFDHEAADAVVEILGPPTHWKGKKILTEEELRKKDCHYPHEPE